VAGGLSGTRVLPDSDVLVCDPIPTIPTRHALATAAEQNYGLATYRIRQPFDFEGRTGTIKLDMDLSNNGLGGWPALVISQDPAAAPSFDWQERGSGPRNGIEIEFGTGWCNTAQTLEVIVYAFSDYNQTAFGLGASDSWKEWRWNGNFSQAYGSSSGVASILGLDSSFDDSTRAGGLTLSRNFMENKARLTFDNREIWRHDSLSGDGNNRSSEFTDNVNFSFQATPRVTLDAGYGFARVGFSGEAFNSILVPGGAPVQVTTPFTDYLWSVPLNRFEAVATSPAKTSPAVPSIEM